MSKKTFRQYLAVLSYGFVLILAAASLIDSLFVLPLSGFGFNTWTFSESSAQMAIPSAVLFILCAAAGILSVFKNE